MDIKTASMLLILQYWSSLYKGSKYISYLIIAYNVRYVFRLATKNDKKELKNLINILLSSGWPISAGGR